MATCFVTLTASGDGGPSKSLASTTAPVDLACDRIAFKRRRLIRQLLARADDEIASRRQRGLDPRQYTSLQVGRKIGEGQVAAEHQVEGARWRLVTQVLL